MHTFIAERRLIAESTANGERTNITIRVGTPYWVVEGELAACPVQFNGLFREFNDMKGMDLLQALQLASNVDAVLAAMSGEFNFFWESGEEYDLDEAKAILKGV
jgi:hypothetical protein